MKRYDIFLIDGYYCVAKLIKNHWTVWLRTKSKLEADLFFRRLDPPFELTTINMWETKFYHDHLVYMQRQSESIHGAEYGRNMKAACWVFVSAALVTLAFSLITWLALS